MRLYEKYRPTTFADVVGQDKAVARLRRLAEGGNLGGRAFWISGGSGTGKTTVARILAAEVADPMFTVELDAHDLTPAKLRELEYDSHYSAFGKGGRAYIVNEAHGLRKDTVRQLLVLLERVKDNALWVFTTTVDGQTEFEDCGLDAGPLLSRCIRVSLTTQGLCKPFALRVQEIAQLEGLDGQPLARYERLLKLNANNFRAALQAVEAGEMTNGKD